MRGNVAGDNIKRLRKDRGLSQEELAARVSEITGKDVSIATISKIEKGQMGVKLDWYEMIAEALGISLHEIIAATPVRLLPIIGQIAAGHWSEAIEDPEGWMPGPADLGGPHAFALRAVGDSMDRIVGEGGYIVVDPDLRDLAVGKVYAVRNVEGETTFKQYSAEPPQLVPCSNNPKHRPIPIGQDPFVVIGRVIWAGSPL